MLHLERLTMANGYANWVLYETGKYARPLAILSDSELDVLLDSIEKQRSEMKRRKER